MGMKQIWDGKDLPPVGCEVLIKLASIDTWVAKKVTGYKIWPSLDAEDKAHVRVFITVEGNERLLCDVRPLDFQEPRTKAKK